jgi:Uma2 family endonuclease
MAISLRPVRPVTDEELLALSERNPGYQLERSAGGELIVTPTGNESARREQEVAAQLWVWATHDGRGIAFGASAGFRLPDGSVFAPDASWVQRVRLDALSRETREGFAPLCPDVVFEVLSKSDTPQDLRAKMRVYMANGARAGVLIDPYQRMVEVYRPGRDPETHTDATVALDPELPGFALDLKPIIGA